MKAEKLVPETNAGSMSAAAAAGFVQRKAAIASETNPLEDEVDEKADRRVMRMAESPFVQRKCDHCEQEEKMVQRTPAVGGITPFIQRSVKDKPCRVHAFDNSNTKDKAVVVDKPGAGTIGVSSVDDMVTKTNNYINDKGNDCSCVSSLEINGHGTDGYQSVGNGDKYVIDDKSLVYSSPQAQIDKLKGIKFCDKGMLLLLGCHVGEGNGKALEKRISNALPGVLVGGGEHFTFGSGMGGKQVVGNEADVTNGGHSVDTDKGTPFLQSPHVRWYFTTKDGVEYTRGSDNTPADLSMKIKTSDKVKVVTQNGETIKVK